MASKSLQRCEISLRNDGILVDGFVHSGNHASLTAAFRVDVPYSGVATEVRHILVVARYRVEGPPPANATLHIKVSRRPMTTDSVIKSWKRGLSQGSSWLGGEAREFKITGPRSHLLGIATPFVMMHCSAMVTMAAAVYGAETKGSHRKIAAQYLASRLQDRLNTAAEELDELAGG